MVAGNLAVEAGKGSEAGLGDARGREGKQHGNAAFVSWENATSFE
jgi:hypothetical protein